MKTNAAVPLFRGFLIALAIAIPLALIGSSVSSQSSKLVIAPDLAQRLAKFKKVHMPFDSSKLTDREKKMVNKLVDASGLLDCIYWRQSDPDGLKLYLSLTHTTNPQFQMLAEYLKINGGRFDLIDDNKPFVGTEPMPPGRGFFPWGMTPDEFNSYVTAHPDQKAALYSPYTMVRRKGDLLEAVPYHVAFAQFLKPMAQDLRAAADLSDDPAFANFLRLRADALLTDDYYKSDIAWLDLKDPKFDVIFAPYEIYLDGLLGVKTSYGASVMIRNDAESKKAGSLPEIRPRAAGIAGAAGGRPALRSTASNRRWRWSTACIARAICCTDTRPSPIICPTIRAFTRKKARRRCSGRISWTRA